MIIVDRIPMTKEGYEKIKSEIDHIKTVLRPQIINEIEAAMAHGDLSENAEYHAAKERNGHITGRLMDLEARFSKAEVIDPKTLVGQSKIMFGAHVTLFDEEIDKTFTYQIVGEFESDAPQGKISVTSPMARALIGKSEGDLTVVKTPKGNKELEITKVQYK